jgi:hypothetical protein
MHVVDVRWGSVGVLQLRRLRVNPHAVLTFAHGQHSGQLHRCCRRGGLGRGTAGQHDADDAEVRLECGCVAVSRTEREPHALGQCSHLLMGSLGGNNFGDAGAQDLGAALRVNTTLTTL